MNRGQLIPFHEAGMIDPSEGVAIRIMQRKVMDVTFGYIVEVHNCGVKHEWEHREYESARADVNRMAALVAEARMAPR